MHELLTVVPVASVCRACDHRLAADAMTAPCPSCGSPLVDGSGGDELAVGRSEHRPAGGG